jgi:hypothetical protein
MTPAPSEDRHDKLGPAFDALAREAPRLRNITWLPFAAIALLALLIAGLFMAIVLEDKQLQREAAQRDIDSAAQQLGVRLGSLTEALATSALEVSSGGMSERRFLATAGDGAVRPRLGSCSQHPVAQPAGTHRREPATTAGACRGRRPAGPDNPACERRHRSAGAGRAAVP